MTCSTACSRRKEVGWAYRPPYYMFAVLLGLGVALIGAMGLLAIQAYPVLAHLPTVVKLLIAIVPIVVMLTGGAIIVKGSGVMDGGFLTGSKAPEDTVLTKGWHSTKPHSTKPEVTRKEETQNQVT